MGNIIIKDIDGKHRVIPAENGKNCVDCRYLRAKIPLVKIEVKTKFKTFFDIGLNYKKAGVFCKNGLLLQSDDKNVKDKIFKNVLVLKKYKNQAFEYANKCAFYESMIDGK